jgi:hypothetical protein
MPCIGLLFHVERLAEKATRFCLPHFVLLETHFCLPHFVLLETHFCLPHFVLLETSRYLRSRKSLTRYGPGQASTAALALMPVTKT